MSILARATRTRSRSATLARDQPYGPEAARLLPEARPSSRYPTTLLNRGRRLPTPYASLCMNLGTAVSPCPPSLKHVPLALALAALSALSAAAQEVTLDELLSLDLDQLADYKIEGATRTDVTLASAPGAVTLITRDQIERSTARTIPDLLRQVAGVNVRWNPMVQTISIRGFGASPFTSRVLLLIDGVPYNSWNKGGFPQHPGFDFFNLANVRHIEVVRGPGSSLYGANALEGVINIVTRSADDAEGTEASLLFGERNTRILSASHGTRFSPDVEVFASARVLNSQLPMELWTDDAGDAQAYDVFLKARARDFTISWYRLQDEFDGFERPAEGFGPGAAFRSADQIEQTVNIIAGEYRRSFGGGRWDVRANLSHARRNGSHCAACHAPAQAEELRRSADHGSQTLATVQANMKTFDHHELLFALESRRLEAGDHDEEFSGGLEDHAGHSTSLGPTDYIKTAMVIQDQMSWRDDTLLVTAGVRMELPSAPDLIESSVYPRVAVVWRPTDPWRVHAGWSEAARYPSFTELYQDSWFLAVDIPQGDPVVLAEFTPNPDLRPERIRSWTAGVSRRLGPKLQLSADVYRNRVSSPLVPVYPTFGTENHPADARAQGVELGLQLQASDGLSAYANWAYQENDQIGAGVDSVGQPIDFSYSPRHKLNGGFSATLPGDLRVTLDVSWRGEYLAPAFWYPIVFGDPQRTPLPAYALANIELSKRFALSRKNTLRVGILGRNLLDETPYETLAGLGGPLTGREFFLTASMSRRR